MHPIVLLVAAISIFRNPFVFRESPQPVRTKHAVVHAQPVVPVTTPTIETPPTIFIAPPPKPLLAWRYIGSFGPDSDRVAAFSKDHDVLTVRAGDAVDGYAIRGVNPDFVEFIVEGRTRRIGLGD